MLCTIYTRCSANVYWATFSTLETWKIAVIKWSARTSRIVGGVRIGGVAVGSTGGSFRWAVIKVLVNNTLLQKFLSIFPFHFHSCITFLLGILSDALLHLCNGSGWQVSFRAFFVMATISLERTLRGAPLASDLLNLLLLAMKTSTLWFLATGQHSKWWSHVCPSHAEPILAGSVLVGQPTLWKRKTYTHMQPNIGILVLGFMYSMVQTSIILAQLFHCCRL